MNVLFISTGRRSKEITEALKKQGVTVKTIVRGNIFQKLSAFLFDKYDVLHTDNAFLDSALASIIGRLRGKKVTCIIRGYGDHFFRNKYSLITRASMFLTERISFRFLNHVFFISQDTKNHITTVFNVKSWSIAPNGMNVPKKIKKLNIKSAVKEKTGKYIKKEDVVIVSATNLKFKEKAQGIKILQTSMKYLPKNSWIIVLGDGKYLSDVKKTAPENMLFLGFHNNVLEWLSASDIFAYCSFLDAFPTVMLEAQAAGLPIVASNTCGLPETAKYAKLIKPTPEEFAKALYPLIKSKKLRQARGKKNKDRIKKRNWLWATQKYIKIWRSLINEQ